jgi:hypothetical protein
MMDVSGIQCADLAMSLNMSFSKFPGLPKNFELKSATTEITGKMKQPIDKSALVPEENADSALKVIAEGKGPGDIELQLTITVQRTSSAQRKALP